MKKRNEVIEFLSVIYQSDSSSINIIISDDNIWATQKAISELFDCAVNNIAYHIKEIINSKELDESKVLRKINIKQLEGTREVSRSVLYCSLEMILAIGYRVNSTKAIEFRSWANNVLKEFTIKGFVIDSYRLSNGAVLTKDYYDELLEEIKLIRMSERRLYQKVTDIFVTAIDYDNQAQTTLKFFKTVQNKLHYSVSGKTAAEIIYHRADSTKEHMGLTTWKRAPEGRIHSTDVVIAKNYLDEEELTSLKNVVNLFLDFAEDMATRHIPLTMNDYVRRLDILLELSGRKVLNNAGSISHDMAEKFALSEFEKYKLIQESKIINHFDLYIENPKLFELPNINNKYKDELKEFINKEVVVYVDRPINSVHPKYNDIIYPLNYGYIKEIKAPDGEYQDAYILGINKKVDSFRGIVIAIIDRLDDNESKLVVVPNGLEYSDEEIEEQIQFQEKYFKHKIVRK